MSTNKSTIIAVGQEASEPFTVAAGRALVLLAEGLQGADRVVVEMLSITRAGPAGGECCPGPVTLPEEYASGVLRCRNGARAILTKTYPWLQLDAPVGQLLRARFAPDGGVENLDMTQVMVTLEEDITPHNGCADCQCVEPYCASYELTPKGYMFVAGDERDPEATVEIEHQGVAGWVFPTPRINATVPVWTGEVTGYAANRGCS